MMLSAHFIIASERPSGFSAEQILYNRGFYELGRRTNATAWAVRDTNEVVRISEDGKGSEAYFDLADKLNGNPYMPIVYGHKTLASGDHIAHVEKLQNPAIKETYAEYRQIRTEMEAGKPVSEFDRSRFEKLRHMAEMTVTISNFFMSPKADLDIESLPQPQAFRQAAEAITELSLAMYKSDPRTYAPIPDMNKTNIMWRNISGALQPVLYDPIGIQRSPKTDELKHAVILREKLGMSTDLQL